MDYFTGCTALITGASAGIGKELARQLAPHARTLILVARRVDRLEELKSELLQKAPHLRVICHGADLSRHDEISKLASWVDQEDIDLLINNAGLGDHGRFEKSNWPKVEQILDVNIGALTQLTHHLLPMLRSRPRAAILNVSSVASFLPIPDMAVYAATKAYVTSFSEALRAELRDSNVSVTALCPGPVSTEFGSVARRDDGTELIAPEVLKIPVERVAREALIAVSKNKARVVPGSLMATAAAAIRLMPLFLLRPFLRSRH